jgi:hypothetical protein
VQLGLVEFIKPQRVNKAMTGHFKKANVAPMRYVGEVRIDDSKDETKAGDRVLVDRFKLGRAGGHHRREQGQGISGRREALALSAAATRRTARCFTARRAESARARFLRACGRGSIFRGTWATSARPRRICA